MTRPESATPASSSTDLSLDALERIARAAESSDWYASTLRPDPAIRTYQAVFDPPTVLTLIAAARAKSPDPHPLGEEALREKISAAVRNACQRFAQADTQRLPFGERVAALKQDGDNAADIILSALASSMAQDVGGDQP